MPDVHRACRCRLCEPGLRRGEVLDDGDRKLLDDVQQYGWHVVLIPDDAVSRGWAFTVGMWHTLRSPDLALFGLDLSTAHSVLNLIGDAVRDGRTIAEGAEMDDIVENGLRLAFRAIDDSWHGPMFGYWTWFNRGGDPPLMQVVWPDSNGRRPWTEGVDPGYAAAQPSLWIPAHKHPQDSWSGALAPDPWPFEDAPDTAAFTTRRIALDGADVLGVSHDEDGSWQFLDGGSTNPEDAALVHMAHVVGAHNDVAELADLPTGWQAWRASVDSRWKRSKGAD